jgi:hypothetical protein
MSKRVEYDRFFVELFSFLAGIHSCHVCKYTQNQINRQGKKRTFCTKYGLPIQRIHWHCIDRFQGFNNEEIQELTRQYKDGKCTLIIGGVAV